MLESLFQLQLWIIPATNYSYTKLLLRQIIVTASYPSEDLSLQQVIPDQSWGAPALSYSSYKSQQRIIPFAINYKISKLRVIPATNYPSYSCKLLPNKQNQDIQAVSYSIYQLYQLKDTPATQFLQGNISVWNLSVAKFGVFSSNAEFS